MPDSNTYGRTRKSLRNSATAVILQVIAMLIGFFSRRIFIRVLGVEVMGLNTTASSILDFLNLAELGIETAVSVIVPVFNAQAFLDKCLQSLAGQTLQDLEIICVDDCSTDNTAEIAGEYGCVVISHEESKGPVVAKNTGLKAAKGHYILFMDHDDKMRDGALKALVKAFDEAPDAYAVQAMVQDFKSPDCEGGALSIRPEPYYGLFTGAILIRRKAFDIIGLFPTDHSAGEIIDWSDRMREHGLEVKKIDLVSADRRVHQSNFGRTRRAEEMKNYAAILRARLKASLDRD